MNKVFRRRPGSLKKAAPTRPQAHADGRRFVFLEYIQPDAQEVCIAGSFNDWRPLVTPMVSLGSGRWVKRLALLPGRYEYIFVVDGRWLADLGFTIEVSEASRPGQAKDGAGQASQ